MTVKSMKSREKLFRKEVISLKKPTALDKIIETVPKPKGAIPNFGLPKWKLMPLESKIPMIPGPIGAYNFTRQKLGKKLWVQTKNAEFNLNDPCNYEMEFSYDSLHDEHLTRYFSRKSNIKRMIKLGFVTKNLDAKCSLKDYNMYRKFLRKLHSDSINQELKRLSNLADEKRILSRADFAAQREIQRLKIAERKTLARDKARKELREREEKKNQAKRQREEALKKHKESVELAKKEAMQMRILKSKAQEERMRQKRAAAMESKQLEIIKTLITWARKESKRRKARKERLSRVAEEKSRAIEEKWQRRKELEKKEIDRKKSALNHAKLQRETYIENYKKKIDHERACIQRRIKKIRRFVKCYKTRKAFGHHGHSCCQNFKRQKKVKEGNEAAVSITAKSKSTRMKEKRQ